MKYLISTTAMMLAAGAALAQTDPTASPTPYINVCDSAPYNEFDFWVGDWIAFDYDTGIAQGVDRIEKIAGGCALMQDWIQLTDRYRTPGAPVRYFGNSISAPLIRPGGGWQQVWVNQGGGGAITLRGGINETGTMIIATDERAAPDGRFFRQVWYWDPIENGRIHSWGEIQIRQAGESDYSETQIPWNLIYIPRADAPSLIAGPSENN